MRERKQNVPVRRATSAPARVPRRPAAALAVLPTRRPGPPARRGVAALRLATPRRGGDYIRELSGRRSDQTCVVLV